MGLNFLKNPFFLYITSFGIVALVYLLGWSNLFPTISLSVKFFLVSTFIISFFLGLMFQKVKPIEFITTQGKNPRMVLLVIYILYSISFLHNSGIPLLLVLNKAKFHYGDFGIPFFQPIITTFTSFYTVYLFHLLICKRSRSNIINLVLILLIPLLVYNRGMLVISLVNFAIMFFMFKSKIKLKTVCYLGAICLVVFYYFGKLGNYRMVKKDSSQYMLKVGEATENFKTSKIPKEFFWTYVYSAAPLANFQKTVNENSEFNYKVINFLSYELLPDFISKRITNPLGIVKERPDRIASFLTVGTLYSSGYKYIGWIGPIIMYFYLVLIIAFFWLFLKKNNTFYVTGFSILGTFVFFNIFSNMIYFSGISFQLIYPIIYQLITKKKSPVINEF